MSRLFLEEHTYTNETYWLIETNASRVLVKVYRFNVCVGSFELEVDRAYRLKVLVSDMIVQAPRGLVIKISLTGTKYTWILTSEPSYILENMPHATYQISIEGTNFMKAIYFEGGVISIGEIYSINIEALKLILPPATAPPIIIGVKRAVRNRRNRNRHNRKAKSKSTRRKIKDDKKKKARKPTSLAEALLMTET